MKKISLFILMFIVLLFIYSGLSLNKTNVIDFYGKVYNLDALDRFVNKEDNNKDIRIIQYQAGGRTVIDLHYYGQYHTEGKFNNKFNFSLLENIRRNFDKIVFVINGHRTYKQEDDKRVIYFLQQDVSDDQISNFTLLEHKK
jgi:hypothetical protein